ncbi:hypothetical protein BASA60_004896 [Batrachochytrium salamandrivorans]|nr:hypothetical protein BASA60_004896 [Batrachochytrium salamandrivorans]
MTYSSIPLVSQKKKRAITAATHSISPLLRKMPSPQVRLTIFNGLVLGVAYYGPRTYRRQLTLARRLQAPVNTGIRIDSQGPFIHPIAPMLTDCGIISLDAHAILARVRLTKIPLSYPFCSSQYALFHFNIPISTNGLFHNPNPPFIHNRSNISRSIPNTHPYTPESLLHHYYPLYPNIAEIRHQRSNYALERTFQVWGKSKLACSYVQANHASSAKFLRSPALSTGPAIGASLLSLARCGGLWDYPRALKAGLLHPTETGPRPAGQSQPVHAFEPPISVAHQGNSSRQAQDTVEETPPLPAGPHTTDHPHAAISSTPHPGPYIGLHTTAQLIGGNSTLARRLQAPVNTGIRMVLRPFYFTPIAQCSLTVGSLVWTRMPIGPRPAYSQAHYIKTPLRTLLLPSTIPFHSNPGWTRRSRSLIRFVHPNMSLFHFNIPISTNVYSISHIHQLSITSSNSADPSQTPNPYTPESYTSILSPLPQPLPRSDTSAPSMHRTYIQVWGKSKLACSYVQAKPRVKCKILSRAPQYWPAIGASLLSLARCGGYGTILGQLKQGLLHPTATNLYQLGSPAGILCHAHLDCKRHGPTGDTRFEPPISVAHSEIPGRPRTQWKKTPLPAGPPTQTTPHPRCY